MATVRVMYWKEIPIQVQAEDDTKASATEAHLGAQYQRLTEKEIWQMDTRVEEVINQCPMRSPALGRITAGAKYMPSFGIQYSALRHEQWRCKRQIRGRGTGRGKREGRERNEGKGRETERETWKRGRREGTEGRQGKGIFA